MNPEFERNVWLEMTPRRIVLMVALLGLIFFAVAAVGDGMTPGTIAISLYYFIVVVWGTRNAAMSVVGEIRDRTWDSQRLSSLGAGRMMWGKLFGSTIYNWFGGLICLGLVMVDLLSHEGVATALIELVYFIAIGVIAQSASFLASLVAIARRQSYSRLEVFVYQFIGLVAAWNVYSIWTMADPAAGLLTRKILVVSIAWWGQTLDARGFMLVSLAIFSAWTLIGCYREMRLELKMRNGPLVWLGFLVFMGVYVAGFGDLLTHDLKAWNAIALRLGLAATTYAGLTYVMVLLEPKDRVHYRWMQGELLRGHIGNALNGLQSWMMAYAATFACVGALCVWLARDPTVAQTGQPLLLAGMGFLTRDVALFVLMNALPGRRRGDISALAILFALYVLAPMILVGLKAESGLFLFLPQPQNPTWMGAAAAWIEGLVLAGVATARLALPERERTPAPA